MEKLGKTLNIASRLPHFYDTKNAGSLLYQFIDVFGYIIEQAETDLMEVMRAHHVDTASNEDSQGFIGKQKGDLDKIFTLYLETLGGTSQLIQISDRFTAGSIKNVNSFVYQLQTNTDEVSQYFRENFSPLTKDLLERYQATGPSFHQDSFKNLPKLAISILVAENPLSKYLKTQLDAKSKEILSYYDGSEPVPQPLQEILLTLLNKQLTNPYFYTRNKAYFHSLPLLEIIKQLLAAPTTYEDRLRLHRLLLETAYPQYIQPRNIPSKAEVENILIQELNRFLEGYKREGKTAENLGNLIKQNRRLLEITYPNELEKSYAPYRERLKGIISILRRGAATRQGILDLVAANLGILGESDAALAAKKQIRIEEFAPEIMFVRPPIGESESEEVIVLRSSNNSFDTGAYDVSFFDDREPHLVNSACGYLLRLFQEFTTFNPNAEPSEIEIKVEVASILPVEKLYNPRIVHVNTGEVISYEGAVKAGDVLLFRRDTVLVNGQPYYIQNPPPLLPINISKWRFEAQLVPDYPLGLFNQKNYNLSTLGFAQIAVYLEMRIYKLNPGRFEVIIPWDIPGYTDKFDEALDHPRNQIANIINHVKAAGVLAIINYEKFLRSHHDLAVELTIERSPFLDEHISEEKFNLLGLKIPYSDDIRQEMRDRILTSGFDYATFDSGSSFAAGRASYPDENYHEMSDKLVISGVFDYTEFDSGNNFD